MGNLIAFVLISVPVPEFLLLFDVGESINEPLYMGTVASSVLCEFNHPVAESFSKTSWICAEAAHHPSDGFAVRERKDGFFWVLGRWKEEN